MTVTGPYEHQNKFIGLSSETKPTVNVLIGSTFYETDTGRTYIYTGITWARE